MLHIWHWEDCVVTIVTVQFVCWYLNGYFIKKTSAGIWAGKYMCYQNSSWGCQLSLVPRLLPQERGEERASLGTNEAIVN